MQQFPQREWLNDEVHARPHVELYAPEQLSYLALLVNRDEREQESEYLHRLCRHYNITKELTDKRRGLFADLGEFRMKVERHEEFTSYMFFRPCQPGTLFDSPVSDILPQDWLDNLPGQLLVAAQVAIVPGTGHVLDTTPQGLSSYFSGNRVVGAKISAGAGEAFTDFRIHEDGYSRFLIFNHQLSPGQAGRAMQRLLEIETYRMMALLGLPEARPLLPDLKEADAQLVEITAALEDETSESDEHLLDQLTELAGVIENRISATYARFNATRNYASLVDIRLEELRETRIEGLPTFSEFLNRRLNPAMRTCDAVDNWLHQLSSRIGHANQLLRTRIDVRREQQNLELMRQLNRRSEIQLRLQQTIETLSVAAITYAAVSLIGLVMNGLKSLGLPINTDLIMALSIPVIGYLVYLGAGFLREAFKQNNPY
jgi:uncharacterized membrane-anchored protein